MSITKSLTFTLTKWDRGNPLLRHARFNSHRKGEVISNFPSPTVISDEIPQNACVMACPLNTEAFNKLLLTAEFGDTLLVTTVLERMTREHIPLDVMTFNQMLRITCGTNFELTMDLLNRFMFATSTEESTLYMNELTMELVLRACEYHERYSEGLQIARILRDKTDFMLDTPMYALLLRFCSLIKDDTQLSALIQEMATYNIPMDIECYNAMLALHLKVSFDKVLSTLEVMIQSHITPNLRTYNSIISACQIYLEYDRAFQFFEEMKKHYIIPNLVTYNLLLIICYERLDVFSGASIHDDLAQPRMTAQISRDKAIIVDLSINLFIEMQELEVWPNTFTYNIMLSIMMKCRDSRVFLLFEKMKDDNRISSERYRRINNEYGFKSMKDNPNFDLPSSHLRASLDERQESSNRPGSRLPLHFENSIIYNSATDPTRICAFSAEPNVETYRIIIQASLELREPQKCFNFFQLLKKAVLMWGSHVRWPSSLSDNARTTVNPYRAMQGDNDNMLFRSGILSANNTSADEIFQLRSQIPGINRDHPTRSFDLAPQHGKSMSVLGNTVSEISFMNADPLVSSNPIKLWMSGGAHKLNNEGVYGVPMRHDLPLSIFVMMMDACSLAGGEVSRAVGYLYKAREDGYVLTIELINSFLNVYIEAKDPVIFALFVTLGGPDFSYLYDEVALQQENNWDERSKRKKGSGYANYGDIDASHINQDDTSPETQKNGSSGRFYLSIPTGKSFQYLRRACLLAAKAPRIALSLDGAVRPFFIDNAPFTSGRSLSPRSSVLTPIEGALSTYSKYPIPLTDVGSIENAQKTSESGLYNPSSSSLPLIETEERISSASRRNDHASKYCSHPCSDSADIIQLDQHITEGQSYFSISHPPLTQRIITDLAAFAGAHIHRNLDTYHLLLRACVEMNQIPIGKALWKYITSPEFPLTPNITTVTCMMKLYCKAKSIEGATELMSYLRLSGITPTLEIYYSYLETYRICKNSSIFTIFDGMIQLGLKPDASIYRVILHYLVENKPEDTLGMLEKMKSDSNVTPDVEIFNLILNLFSEKTSVDDAKDSIKLVKESKLPPFCDIAEKSRMSLELYEEMKVKDIIPTIETFHALLSIFAATDEGSIRWIFNEMLHFHIRPKPETFAILLKHSVGRSCMRTFPINLLAPCSDSCTI